MDKKKIFITSLSVIAIVSTGGFAVKKLKKKIFKRKEDMITAFPLVSVYSELVKPDEEHLKNDTYPFSVQIALWERIEQTYSEMFGEDWEVCKELLQEDIINSLKAFVGNMGMLSNEVSYYKKKENET